MDGVTALSNDTLEEIGERARPCRRTTGAPCAAGIVHLGVGGFHRAHQAMYVDALLEREGSDGAPATGASRGVGLLEQDAGHGEVMHAQDCLYTLVVKQPDGSLEPRVIGSIVDYLFAPDDAEAVLDRMVDPATRIVSLTITEGGYHVNQATGDFDDSDPVDPGRHRGPPATARRPPPSASSPRRSRGAATAGTAPFTVMSCDNIQGNGTVAHDMITAFATRATTSSAGWIGEHVAFPNSMVDRITPVTTDDDRAARRAEFGIDDGWPVRVRVVRAVGAGGPVSSSAARRWSRSGSRCVDDVGPYELMKLRLLNASHQALVLPRLPQRATATPTRWLQRPPASPTSCSRYMDRRGHPDAGAGARRRPRRLQAPADRALRQPRDQDTLARLCAESSNRIPKWLVPVVRSNLENDGEVRLSALVVAAWARYAEGVDEDGDAIEVVDRRKDAVMERAAAAAATTRSPSSRTATSSTTSHDQPRFTEPYVEALALAATRRGARRHVLTRGEWP